MLFEWVQVVPDSSTEQNWILKNENTLPQMLIIVQTSQDSRAIILG